MDLIKHLETARAVMETSFQLQSRSMTGTAAFRSHMDHTRQAIQESRELLKRLRNATAKIWPRCSKTRTISRRCAYRGSMPTFSAPHFKT